MEKSESTLDKPEVLRHSLGRRMYALGCVAIMATAGFKLAENVYDIYREDLSTTVETLSDRDVERDHPERAWIMVPGYGMAWMDSRDAAQFMRPELENTGQVHWIGYSNKGLDVDELKSVVHEHIEDKGLKEVNFYGYSMGGEVSIELAKYLEERGIEVGHIILDSSPSGPEDVVNTNVVRFVSAGGVGSLSWSAIQAATTDSGPIDILRNNGVDHVSAPLLRDTASYIRNFSLEDAVEGLPGDIDFSYIGSANDAVVDTESAAESYEAALGNNSFRSYDSYPSDHASPRGYTDIYLDLMKKVNNQVIDKACDNDWRIDIGAIEELCPVEPEDPITPPGLVK